MAVVLVEHVEHLGRLGGDVDFVVFGRRCLARKAIKLPRVEFLERLGGVGSCYGAALDHNK
jgi:hypothetical protein